MQSCNHMTLCNHTYIAYHMYIAHTLINTKLLLIHTVFVATCFMSKPYNVMQILPLFVSRRADIALSNVVPARCLCYASCTHLDMQPAQHPEDDLPDSAIVDLEQVTAAVDLLPTVESTSAPAGKSPPSVSPCASLSPEGLCWCRSLCRHCRVIQTA